MADNQRDSQDTLAEFYFQYEIVKDRPGLLGDIASLLGMLGFNILQLGGVSEHSRGFLLQTRRPASVHALKEIVEMMDDVELAALRTPSLRDRIALRHGRFIERSDAEMRTYRFVRDELGVLVDFLGELLKRPGKQVIGVRGQPRVGKTESIVAASVYANKKWVFVSSTLLKQTMLKELPGDDVLGGNAVFIIDGAVSTLQGGERHQQVVDEVLRLPVPVVIEHPDIFVKHSMYGWSLFDCLLELRRHPDEAIQFEAYEQEAAQWHD
ncbi:MAG: YmfK family protein [Alicyclobacillus sp.]|nr:YmfK family protein [Alicyclobacillus sp.]